MKERGIIRHIVMPLGNAGITTLIIFQFMVIWREFFWPLLIINEDSLRTVTLGVAFFFQQESQDWGLVLSATTTALLPILLVFVIFQRRFIKGITWSGMKV
jgi:ABC-type glycerol-3-phosphate transport system permease component